MNVCYIFSGYLNYNANLLYRGVGQKLGCNFVSNQYKRDQISESKFFWSGIVRDVWKNNIKQNWFYINMISKV